VTTLMQALNDIDVYKNFENSNAPPPTGKEDYTFSEVYARMLTSDTKLWVGNKTPQNTENIDKLHKLFPDAKFILIVRDVRDVALSWQKKWGKDKLLCAYKWNRRMRKGIQLLEANIRSESYLIVKYEDLLSDLSSTSMQICEFLGIPFDENMLEFHNSVTSVVEGKLNYGKPVLVKNTSKWVQALSQSEITRIEEIAFDSLSCFNYSISSADRQRPITLLEKYAGFANDVYALVFIGNRAIEKDKFRNRLKTIGVQVRKLVQKKAF
ncbi:MAG: sulfotransferase, partial [Elainellaceae cyanobacterium]